VRSRSQLRGMMPVEQTTEQGENDPVVEATPERLDLLRVLGDLSPDERRLLRMRYGEDLTQPRVAAQLGIPEGTIKVRLHRVRARLRLALEEGLDGH
jgi:RNA polymerase sigma-70 factor, ECF subfamily